MTIQGIIVLNLIGIGLLFWVLHLVRLGRLYVGYGVIFILTILMTIVLLSVPGLLTMVTHLVGAVFPASALTLLALCFIVLLLVYVLTQVTIISNRLAVLAQELAIRQANEDAKRRNGDSRIPMVEEKP
jgi:hypothetical protein